MRKQVNQPSLPSPRALLGVIRSLGLNFPFLLSSGTRYAGPLLLAIGAPVLVGSEAAKGIFVLLSSVVLAVTVGRLGVDNEILKSIGRGERQVRLRWTVFVWMPVTGLAAAALVPILAPDSVRELPIAPWTYLLLYVVLFMNALVSATLQVRGDTRLVQLFELGTFQLALLGILAGVGLWVRTPGERIATSLSLLALVNAVILVGAVARDPHPFFRKEVLGVALVRERLNCFVPNMVTYVSAWGLILPLASVPAIQFNQINAALRIGSIGSAITTLGVLLGIRDRSLAPAEAFQRCRRLGIILLGLATVPIVAAYALGLSWVASVPNPLDPAVLTIYLAHVIAVLIGPTMYFANVMGQHLRINLMFAGLCLLVGVILLNPGAGVLAAVAIVVYIQVLSRLFVLPPSRVPADRVGPKTESAVDTVGGA